MECPVTRIKPIVLHQDSILCDYSICRVAGIPHPIARVDVSHSPRAPDPVRVAVRKVRMPEQRACEGLVPAPLLFEIPLGQNCSGLPSPAEFDQPAADPLVRGLRLAGRDSLNGDLSFLRPALPGQDNARHCLLEVGPERAKQEVPQVK